MSPPPASSRAESDLDSTAELPVLDPAGAAAPAADEDHVRTDTWAMAPAARALAAGVDADAVHQLEAKLQSTSDELQSVSKELHEARELLASRGERVVELERARDEGHAALAAAEQRAAALEQRVAALNTELAQRHAGEGPQAARLEESHQARLAAERRAEATDQELAQARALASGAAERAAQLQRRLEQHETDNRVQRNHEVELQQAVLAQGRAHAASMMEDLHCERARAMSYLESLQSLEGRRLIAEGVITDLQHEAEVREADLQHLAREVAGKDGRARELTAELEQRAARIAQLEQQLNASAAALQRRDTQRGDARTQAQGLQASVARLQAEIGSVGERRQALELQLEQNHSAVSQHLAELQRLRSERSELSTALESARSVLTSFSPARMAAMSMPNCEWAGSTETTERMASPAAPRATL